MRKAILIVAACVFAGSLRAGELLDRVVATVNGNALLQSDWDEEVNYEAFMAKRPLSDVSASDRENALNRIIDQQLLREQMHGSEFRLATSEEVDEQIRLLQSEYAHEHPGSSWSAALAKYGFSESEFRERVKVELNQLRLVDEKLRPSVEIDAAEVERYYKQKIASQDPAQAPNFREVEPKIRQLLVQQKINELLDSWLELLRAQARIQRFTTPELNSASAGDKQ